VIALDSSVAVPALHSDLPNHEFARPYLAQSPRLPAHAAVETFSAISRFPEPFRVDAATAAKLIADNFRDRVLAGPSPKQLPAWLARMADAGISGGAIYDALVGETAKLAGATLVTADRRAAETYRAVGVEVQMLGE
jgi:predicted nucleic acid-binding protein